MLKQPISQDSKSKLLWDKAARVFNLNVEAALEEYTVRGLPSKG